jgi:anti-sigma regulatory factor (Ser/Thr protein kinase)
MPYYRCPSCGLTSYSAARYSMVTTCPNCSAGLPVAARLSASEQLDSDITRVLGARPDAPGLARRTVVGLPLPQTTRDILALLASELVTNCVRHAGLAEGDTLSLSISNGGGRIRIAVRDGGAGFPLPSISRGHSMANGGRGLLIVDELADDWGVEQHQDGCTVWCELVVGDDLDDAVERDSGTGALRELAQDIHKRAGHSQPA